MLSSESFMAFGDANNDKDMLAFAKHSYVMENSHDEELSRLPLLSLQVMISRCLTIIEQEVLNK